MIKEISIIALVLVVVLYIASLFASASCYTKGQSFDEVRHSVIGGCMVRHKGKWLPLENIRGFDDK